MTIGANVQPASTGTAAPNRVGTNTTRNCDDHVLIRSPARAKIERVLTTLLRELAAAIAPPGCLSCRRPTARAAERLCPDCTRALPWLPHPCPRCGLPTHRRRPCPATLRRAWAPVAYEGV